MKTTRILFRWGAVVAVTMAISLPVWAGNKVLMEKEGKELVSINEQVIKALPNVRNNSQVKLEANVVQRNGKTEIQIQHLSFTPQAGQEKTERRAVSTRPPRAHKTVGKAERVSTGGGVALSSEAMKAKIDELKAAHPKVRFVELDTRSLAAPSSKSHGKSSRTFVAMWDD